MDTGLPRSAQSLTRNQFRQLDTEMDRHGRQVGHFTPLYKGGNVHLAEINNNRHSVQPPSRRSPMATTSNIHHLNRYRQRNSDEQRQREIVSEALLTVARGLRRLEKLTDNGHRGEEHGGDRAS